MGFGGFSAWGDANAAEVGSVTQVITNSPTIGGCLTTCNTASTCAAVHFTYDVAGQSIASCSLLAGEVSNTNTQRTLVHTRVSSVIFAS